MHVKHKSPTAEMWQAHYLCSQQIVIADHSSDPNEESTYASEPFAIAAHLDDRYPSHKHITIHPIDLKAVQKIVVDKYWLAVVGSLFYRLHPKILAILYYWYCAGFC